MVSSKLSLGLVAILITSVVLSGCAGSSGGGSSPSTSPSGSGGNNSTGNPPPTGNPLQKKEVSAKEWTFDAQNSYVATTFTVDANYTTLTMNYWFNGTAACYVLNDEPPPTGSATPKPAKILAESPSKAQKLEVAGSDLPAMPTTCDSAAPNGKTWKMGTKTVSTPEKGTWTFTIVGRGSSLKAIAKINELP